MPPKRKRAADGAQPEEAKPKKSKKELRAAAMARAKASMKDDAKKVAAVKARKKAEDEGDAAPTPPVKRAKAAPKSSAKKPKAKEDTKRPASAKKVAAAKPAPAAAAADPPQLQPPPQAAMMNNTSAINPEMMAQFMMMQQQKVEQQQRQVPPSPPKNAAYSIPLSDEDDDDAMMPPPPATNLEMQISQQVLANVAALNNNQPTPCNQPPAEAFQFASSQPELNDDAEEVQEDDQPIEVGEDYVPVAAAEEEDEPNKRKWGPGVILSIAAVAIIAFVITLEDDISGDSTASGKIDSVEGFCYYDTVTVESDEYVAACSNEPGTPCPKGGVCEGGKIVGCENWFEVASDDGKKCVLSSDIQKNVDTVIEVLEEKTMEHACSWFSFPSANWPPLFDYAQIQLAKPLELATNPLDVSILKRELVFEEKDGKHYVGLPIDHALEIPTFCSVKTTVKSYAADFLSLIVLAFASVVSSFFTLCWGYPLYAFCCLIVLWIVRRRQQKLAYRSKLIRDIAEVRQMAYEFLQDNKDSAHVVLHIRDHVSNTLHPGSRSQRHYINHEVWPRVMPDFQQDNRVRKSSKLVDKAPRDVWQWAAATSAKKPASKVRLTEQ